MFRRPIRTVWSPDRSFGVEVAFTGQTDDDLYELTVVNEFGRRDLLPLSRLPRNVADVAIVADSTLIFALEYDGNVLVWEAEGGEFEASAEVVPLGGPCSGLEVSREGQQFSVLGFGGGDRLAWRREDKGYIQVWKS